ncbi:ArsA family ATPase [Streptomyces meridianus]|uniref:ArsA family ATPase n=1 Tax=Streptomyces meridianus TaxID=2938945 RepID=A0ABT0X1I0_9ACTN|nr:ArsA-related P-loop ATPase [Streptomyces meridianus]MCM2576414.1 ArsA family ATPase [Streptomyces meridianus]
MRTVLVTGGGGAGRTTTAAVTALAHSRRGLRTLLLTTDTDGPLEALLGCRPSGPGGLPAARRAGTREPRSPWTPPVEAAPGLWAAQLDAGACFRDGFLALQESCRSALDLLGSTPLAHDELTELPGSRALAVLRALRLLHTAPDTPLQDACPSAPPWDLVVVDMPPTPETIALLALPEQLRRYLRRLLPAERQAARALRPLLAQLVGVAMPAESLYGTAARIETELAAAQAAVEAVGTTVRLVVDPGPSADLAVRSARAGLALHGHRLDAVVANRLLPADSPDPWLAALSGQQRAALGEHRRAARDGGFALHELPHLGRDPRGRDDLAELACRAVLPVHPEGPRGPREDGRAGPADRQVEDRLAQDGVLVWRLPLPGADRNGLGLVRHGDELVVTTGPFRRVLPLPSALRRCTVSGAGLHAEVLEVRFTPDTALWPGGPPGEERSAGPQE